MIRVLYILLIYCICFEEILVKMKFSLTNIKFVVAFVLFFMVYKVSNADIKKVKYTKGMFFFSFILFISLLISIPGFLSLDFDGFRIWKQYLWFPFFIHIFSQVEKVAGITLSFLVRTFVNGMVWYTIITFFLFFIPLPIWNDYHVYWGRLTVGYPTIDTVLLCFAILLLFFFPTIQYSFIKKTIMGFILLVGTLMQASGTSIVLLAIIIISMFCYLWKIGLTSKVVNSISYNMNIKSILLLALFVSCTGGGIYSFLSSKEPELARNMILQLENRFYILLGMEEESTLTDVNTLEDRKEGFEHAKNMYLEDILSQFLGIGYANVSMQDFSRKRIVLEDQYHLNLITIGYLGTFFYFLVFVELFIIAFKFWGGEYLYVYIPSILFIISTSFSSFCIATYGIIGIASLIYVSMCFERKRLFKSIK